MKLKFIKTMDFMFENLTVVNCNDIKELKEKIKENEVIEVKSEDGEIDYINSAYIMFFGE